MALVLYEEHKEIKITDVDKDHESSLSTCFLRGTYYLDAAVYVTHLYFLDFYYMHLQALD